MRKTNGSITVFLSLVSLVFLSLICTLVESARVQGARGKAAAVTNIGLYSVFGEYERELLEEFDLLFLDGSYGEGEFRKEKMLNCFQKYMEGNTKEEQGSFLPVTLKECQVSEYSLMTDSNGTVFYQQAIRNQKLTFASDLFQDISKQYAEAEELESKGEHCEVESKNIEEQIEDIKNQEKEEDGAEDQDTSSDVIQKPVKNPLDVIRDLKEKGVLTIVVKEIEDLSQKSINKRELPSGRTLERGNLEGEKQEKGFIEEGMFLEYLKRHFGDFCNPGEGDLSYELEYLICGKEKDQENLKSVVHRLLLMREGSNFLYIMGDAKMKQQAMVLAAAIGGTVPGLASVIKGALLLAWAYGESLLDVRMLLSGGKVPLIKTGESWRLSLENLADIQEILEGCKEGEGKGLTYKEYLQMLLFTGKKQEYPMRALDLIEGRMRKKEGLENFRVDCCVAEVKAEVTWELRSVFWQIPRVFLGVENMKKQVSVSGGFGY